MEIDRKQPRCGNFLRVMPAVRPSIDGRRRLENEDWGLGRTEGSKQWAESRNSATSDESRGTKPIANFGIGGQYCFTAVTVSPSKVTKRTWGGRP
jgi:hypothetical protein